MKVISSLIICLALCACATDYASQLSAPNFGKVPLQYTRDNVDPALMMDGVYASQQLNGPYTPLGIFCVSDGCSRRSPLWSSGWAP
jgi:hypothetical protein